MRVIINYFKKNKTLFLIGIVFIIFILLLIPSKKNNNTNIDNNSVYKNSSEEKYSQPKPETITEFKNESDEYLKNHPLVEKLPYITQDFEISHYVEPFKLVVYIKDKNKEKEILLLVNEWIKNQDNNIYQHKIEFRYK